MNERDRTLRLFHRIGFKSVTTIEKVCAAFPELDMVNHMNRVKLVRSTTDSIALVNR